MPHPTGRQLTIAHGEQTAVVTEVGATLRTYDVHGRAVVDGFGVDRRADGGRGQILAPWPNRVRDGRYTFAGEQHQLALSEVAKSNAIHGLVRWAGWEPVEHTERSAVLTTTVWPQPGYPFLLRLSATYALDDDGLHVEVAATNEGGRPAPYGVGHHPYLTAGGQVDDMVLTVPARHRLLTDERGNPVGEEEVAGTAYDFTSPRRVGDLVLDTAYSDLVPDPSGAPVVRLEHGAHGVEMSLGEGVRHLQVFSGDTLPDPARRRQGLAVEPMSCPPGALASGRDLAVLAPGDSHVLRWGLRGW